MHQYNIGAQFERIAIDVAGPFCQSNQGNQHLLIAVDYFTKRLEAYKIPNQEVLMVAEALVTNFFCHNFGSFLMQEVLECLGVSKTRTTPLHKQ
jgi:hypothetical protein